MDAHTEACMTRADALADKLMLLIDTDMDGDIGPDEMEIVMNATMSLLANTIVNVAMYASHPEAQPGDPDAEAFYGDKYRQCMDRLVAVINAEMLAVGVGEFRPVREVH